MSTDPLAAALSRIAALEAQVSSQRRPDPQFNEEAFMRSLFQDPIGVLSRKGAPIDFMTKVFVAHALGDQAPPELKALAAMGPQVSHAAALDSKVETLSRQISTLTESQTKKGTRESFKALASDKTKYPSLAKALQDDPAFFDEDLDILGGSAEEMATKLEARTARAAKVFAPTPPPASDENADPQAAPSTQSKPATTAGNVPPLPQSKPGVFTEDEHTRLRDEIVRKYSSRSETTP